MTRLFAVAVLVFVTAVVVTAVVLRAQTASEGSPLSATGLAIGELPRERSGFTFCRLMYRSVTQEPLGSGWTTDYPAADRNLMVRVAELTITPVTTSLDDEPLHAVVRATDRALFQCPFLFASDVGTMGLLPDEVAGLRDYLLKGGFLWVDDFWGQVAFDRWSSEIGRVLPGLPIVELPADHPIFRTFFEIKEVPQIPAIGFWNSTRQTAERAGAVARIYGIHDERGRLLVLMSHNTDIADGWEREGENPEYFAFFSHPGYAVGVNSVIWTLTR